jgi:short subunit dehydrogenase-like uncharacterized protein
LPARWATDRHEFSQGESKGGASGGTLATVLYLLTGDQNAIPGAKEAAARGPYALDPAGASGGPDKDDNGGKVVGYDQRVGTWHVPFVMAATNAPVVRKSAALLGYGDGCRYAEVRFLSLAALPPVAFPSRSLSGLSRGTSHTRPLPLEC